MLDGEAGDAEDQGDVDGSWGQGRRGEREARSSRERSDRVDSEADEGPKARRTSGWSWVSPLREPETSTQVYEPSLSAICLATGGLSAQGDGREDGSSGNGSLTLVRMKGEEISSEREALMPSWRSGIAA